MSLKMIVCMASAVFAVGAAGIVVTPAQVLFEERFDRGLARWQAFGQNGAAVVDSSDPNHGPVLALTPNGDDVAAMIRGSESWGDVRIEGEMLFPTDTDNYLGLVYHANHFDTSEHRRDFGLIYVKGNGSYLQVNPHRDLNVSRTIYPELRSALRGASAVATGVWQRFGIEITGRAAHVDIGPASTPQLTFADFERDHGAMGFQPRSVGGPVWVDNIVVRRIDRPSYDGPPIPAPAYAPEDLLTEWSVAGPFEHTEDALAQQRDLPAARWSPFATDARGAVVTGRVVDFHGPRTVAYLRTSIDATSEGPAELQLSTADDLALWVNGRFHWFVSRQGAAWFDFATNAAHAGQAIPISLVRGRNDLVFRVRGGVYATGGFFARVVR